MPSRPSRSLLVVSVAMLLVLQLPASAVVGPRTDELEDARDLVEELDDGERAVRDDLERLTEQLTAFETQLAEANEQLAAADQRAAEAEAEAAAAAATAERTRQELATAQEELTASRQDLAQVVRDAYIHGGSTTSPLLAVLDQLSSDMDAGELTDMMHLLDTVVVERGAVVEDMRRLIERTDQLTRETQAAAAAEAERAAEASEARDRAAQAYAETLALVEGADAAAAQQYGLLGRIEDDRAAAERRVETLEEQARRAADAADAAITVTDLGNGLSRVGGITVATSIAYDVEDLLEGARADGIVLGGYGYRSPETTAALRRANGCPDVYDSPASSCRVPTARPGESMHEQGLAIDFTWKGRTICYPRSASRCSGNAAFDWLRANAGRYGLQVLDSEAWHWSTNGQ